MDYGQWNSIKKLTVYFVMSHKSRLVASLRNRFVRLLFASCIPMVS